MFQVGQHVICIDDTQRQDWSHTGRLASPWDSLHGLTKGRVYTVASVYNSAAGDQCLELCEIVRPIEAKRIGNIGYRAVRFRPLSSGRLSIFRQHLAPLFTDKVEA